MKPSFFPFAVFLFGLLGSFACADFSQAVEVTVYGTNHVLFSNCAAVRNGETAANLTLRTVGQEFHIESNQYGIISIGDTGRTEPANSPEMGEAQNRSYGWCYAVDGKMPNVGDAEVKLTEENRSLVWFYGYSEKNSTGQWSLCEPADPEAKAVLK